MTGGGEKKREHVAGSADKFYCVSFRPISLGGALFRPLNDQAARIFSFWSGLSSTGHGERARNGVMPERRLSGDKLLNFHATS